MYFAQIFLYKIIKRRTTKLLRDNLFFIFCIHFISLHKDIIIYVTLTQCLFLAIIIKNMTSELLPKLPSRSAYGVPFFERLLSKRSTLLQRAEVLEQIVANYRESNLKHDQETRMTALAASYRSTALRRVASKPPIIRLFA